MRILLVEDDQKLSKLMAAILEKEDYVLDAAFSVEAAKEKLAADGIYEAIILDVVLPDGDGVTLCRQIRASGVQTPIMMLTSRGSTVDTVSGLDAGADDYMPKPFSPKELKARLRALLRRPVQTISEEIHCGAITINIQSHSVTKNDQEIELMPKEFALLSYLMRKKNEVVRKDDLLRNVWGIYSRSSSNRLEVYIRYLREKLDIPFGTSQIKTVRGSGYKIADN